MTLCIPKIVELLKSITQTNNWLKDYMCAEECCILNEAGKKINAKAVNVIFTQCIVLPQILVDVLDCYVEQMPFVDCQVTVKDSAASVAKVTQQVQERMAWFTNVMGELDRICSGSHTQTKRFDTLMQYALNMLGVKEITTLQDAKDEYVKQAAAFKKCGFEAPEFDLFKDIIEGPVATMDN